MLIVHLAILPGFLDGCHPADVTHSQVLFILQRKKNENSVIYEAKMEGVKFAAKEQAEAYWLDVSPDAIEKARKKGKMDDRCDLIWLEKSMAYGLSTKPAPGRDGCFMLTLVALPKYEIVLVVIDGQPMAETTISGKKCYLKRIWVESEETWTTPKVRLSVAWVLCTEHRFPGKKGTTKSAF